MIEVVAPVLLHGAAWPLEIEERDVAEVLVGRIAVFANEHLFRGDVRPEMVHLHRPPVGHRLDVVAESNLAGRRVQHQRRAERRGRATGHQGELDMAIAINILGGNDALIVDSRWMRLPVQRAVRLVGAQAAVRDGDDRVLRAVGFGGDDRYGAHAASAAAPAAPSPAAPSASPCRSGAHLDGYRIDDMRRRLDPASQRLHGCQLPVLSRHGPGSRSVWHWRNLRCGLEFRIEHGCPHSGRQAREFAPVQLAGTQAINIMVHVCCLSTCDARRNEFLRCTAFGPVSFGHKCLRRRPVRESLVDAGNL